MTARREAFEEIGLPLPDYSACPPLSDFSSVPDTKCSPSTPDLPYPFSLEHLCQLPTNLAKTQLGVRPCVAFLRANTTFDRNGEPVDAERVLIPRMDAKEVAAVFSGPFHNFLRATDEDPSQSESQSNRSPDGNQAASGDDWYVGSWTEWYHTRFRMHNFYVPIADHVVNNPVSRRRKQQRDSLLQTRNNDARSSSAMYPSPNDISVLPYRDAPSDESAYPLSGLSRFRVFGMTARILVDCARVAYGEEPEFEHNSHFGDEVVIAQLIGNGTLGDQNLRTESFDGDKVQKVNPYKL